MCWLSLPQYASRVGVTRECVRAKLSRDMFNPDDIKRIRYAKKQYYLIREDAEWPMLSKTRKGGRPKKSATIVR